MYYSWDAGCIHFVSVNSESPLDLPQVDPQQIAWLTSDLEAFSVRRAAGRARIVLEGDDGSCSYSAPTFLVVYMHRPMYCNLGGHQDGVVICGEEGSYLRGLMEELFVSNGVDIVIMGHVHACHYEQE